MTITTTKKNVEPLPLVSWLTTSHIPIRQALRYGAELPNIGIYSLILGRRWWFRDELGRMSLLRSKRSKRCKINNFCWAGQNKNTADIINACCATTNLNTPNLPESLGNINYKSILNLIEALIRGWRIQSSKFPFIWSELNKVVILPVCE